MGTPNASAYDGVHEIPLNGSFAYMHFTEYSDEKSKFIPGEGGVYPPCPFLLATGLDCPFCGGLRSTHALLQGDVSRAFDHNVLVPVLFGAVLVGFAWWSLLRITRGPVSVTWSRPVNRWILPTALALLGVFWIVRNLAYFPYLDSGVG